MERQWFDTREDLVEWMVAQLRALEDQGAFLDVRVEYEAKRSYAIKLNRYWDLYITSPWFAGDSHIQGISVFLEWSHADHYESLGTLEEIERRLANDVSASLRYEDVAVIARHFKDVRCGVREYEHEGLKHVAIWNGFSPSDRAQDFALLEELWGWKCRPSGYWYKRADVEGLSLDVPRDALLPLRLTLSGGLSFTDPDAFEAHLGKQRRVLAQWRTYRRMVNRRQDTEAGEADVGSSVEL